MLRRWFDMAVARPELLAEHAGAWAQFLAAEWSPAWRARQRLVLLWAVALLSAGVGLMLGGVALMLAVLTPPGLLSPWPAQLVLWLVPLLPWLLSLICLVAATRRQDDGTWARVTRQWEADRALWQHAGTEGTHL